MGINLNVAMGVNDKSISAQLDDKHLQYDIATIDAIEKQAQHLRWLFDDGYFAKDEYSDLSERIIQRIQEHLKIYEKKTETFKPKTIVRRMLFSLPGEPTAKQSVRFTKFGKNYQPAKLKNRERDIRLETLSKLPKGFKPFENGIRIEYTFIYPYPKAMSRKKRESGEIYKVTRPDIDNLQKFINDALNGLIFQDDSQIVHTECKKRYGDKAETKIYVCEL